MRHISIKLVDIKLFLKIIDLIFATYFYENMFDTSLRKTGSSWKKNVHSHLVRPTVNRLSSIARKTEISEESNREYWVEKEG